MKTKISVLSLLILVFAFCSFLFSSRNPAKNSHFYENSSRAPAADSKQTVEKKLKAANQTLEKLNPARPPSTTEDEIDLNDEKKVNEFLKKRSDKQWTLEKDKSQIERIFGGKLKEPANTDEKLNKFVSELSASMGYENISFSENKLVQKKSAYEVINEFQQHIDNVDIYGAFFRSFRDSNNLNGTYFINEFKKYNRVENTETITNDEVATKIDTYYGRLGKSITEQSCGQKVYYVGAQPTAQLAYKCLVKTMAQAPETFEVLVSAANADILFQKRITIFN